MMEEEDGETSGSSPESVLFGLIIIEGDVSAGLLVGRREERNDIQNRKARAQRNATFLCEGRSENVKEEVRMKEEVRKL